MKSSTRYLVSYWVPVVIWMLVIFTASTDLMSAEHTSRFIAPFLRWLVPEISAAAILAVQFFVRKAAHVTEYAILAGLLVRALRPTSHGVAARAMLGAFIISAIYAASDEFHQSFVASRTSSVHDVFIDICGAALGLLLYWTFSPRGALAHAKSRG